MSNLKSIISSFKLQDELNPQIWYLPNEKSNDDFEGQKEKMRPEIRERLLEISQYFIDGFDLDVVIEDIIVTGSLVNFNWSKYSDVDLHIIIDFKQFPIKYRDTFKNYLNLKKIIFNLKHDIKIKDFDVELYAQDTDESHFSLGTYSVMNDEWVKYPIKETVEIDYPSIKTKSKNWMELIDSAIEESKELSLEEGLNLLKKLKEKIKNFRTSGLEKGGEYSVENLVFKVLRRNGYLEKLFEFQDGLMDKNLTLNESITTVQGVLKVDLENGPANHATRKMNNWQSDNAWDMFAPPGTIVYSFTDGKVTSIYVGSLNSGKVFGTQVSIAGMNNYPNIFYTHLVDVELKIGDVVKVGDRIGVIAKWPNKPDSSSHVHVGLPYGLKLSDVIKGQNMDIKRDEEKKVDKDKLAEEIKNIKLPLNIQKGTFNEDVKKIQLGLNLLGLYTPKNNEYGLYDTETEDAIKKFKSESTSSIPSVNDDDIFVQIMKLFSGLNESKLSSPLSKLYVGNPFGEKRKSGSHPGVDLYISSGSEVKSPEDGVVIDSETRNDACGGTLFIDHQNGFKSRYCHLKRIDVSKGDNVKKGELVGLTGGDKNDVGKGNSMGPHLHFELYKDGKLVDPMEYLDKESTFLEKKIDETLGFFEISKEFLEKLSQKLKEL